MINLSSVVLSSADEQQRQNNLKNAISAGVSFIDLAIPGVYWLDKLTIYESWLLQFVDADSYSWVESSASPAVQPLNSTWYWDTSKNTVIGTRQISVTTAFPTLSVVIAKFGTVLKYLYADPQWLVDSTAAWYAKNCNTIQWDPVQPYLPKLINDEVTDLSNQYNIDCATSVVSGSTAAPGLSFSESLQNQMTYSGHPALTYSANIELEPTPIKIVETSMPSGDTAVFTQNINTALEQVASQQYIVQTEASNVLNQTSPNTDVLMFELQHLYSIVDAAVAQLQQQQTEIMQVADHDESRQQIAQSQTLLLQQKIDELKLLKLPISVENIPTPTQIQLVVSNNIQPLAALPVAIGTNPNALTTPTARTVQANHVVMPTPVTTNRIPGRDLLPLIFVMILLVVILLTRMVRPCHGAQAKNMSREDKRKEFKDLVLDTTVKLDDETIKNVFEH